MLLDAQWHTGYAAGLKRRHAAALSSGFVAGLIFGLLMTATWAFAQVSPKAAQYKHDLTKISRSVWGMDAPIPTLAAQLQQESGWDPSVTSWAGARGIAQFMPATARGLAREYPELAPINEFDYRWGLRAQSLLMRDLLRAYPKAANDCEAYCYALTAYNGGPGWVRRRLAASDRPSRCLGYTARINPGIRLSAQKENEEYPVRILLVLEPHYVDAGWGTGLCGRYSRKD